MFRRKHKKYVNFTVQIEKKVTGIDKNKEEIIKNIFYILQFIDSPEFMASSLPHFVNNVSKVTYRIKCEHGHDDKKCETCGIRCTHCNSFLEYTNFKENLLDYKMFVL